MLASASLAASQSKPRGLRSRKRRWRRLCERSFIDSPARSFDSGGYACAQHKRSLQLVGVERAALAVARVVDLAEMNGARLLRFSSMIHPQWLELRHLRDGRGDDA